MESGWERLSEFRKRNSGLTPDEMRSTVAQAQQLLDTLYVHLPLKRAMVAANPVQRLLLLAQRLESRELPVPDEESFHRAMLDIFNSVRDLHTNYLLPEPFASRVATVPFMLKEYFDETGAHFVVSRVGKGAERDGFGAGAVVSHWNGMPIATAVAVNAEDQAGANDDAKHLRGLMTMTTRPLYTSALPREDWVTVTYRAHGSASPREARFEWMVYPPPPFPNKTTPHSRAAQGAMTLGLDVGLQIANRARQLQFVHDGAGSSAARREATLENSRKFSDELEYGVRNTERGPVGYLGIRSFDVKDPGEFRDEVARIVQTLPPDRLIIDVRGNPGGNIVAGEYLLQLFTDHRPIKPAPVGLRNTLMTQRVAGDSRLERWLPSIELAVETGEPFSQSFPLSDPEGCNALKRAYPGRSILLIDAASYSTTDFFSAGYQDHGIGQILGTTRRTGAGGANVWSYNVLREFFGHLPAHIPPPLAPLPRGIDMRIAFRRSLRIGTTTEGLPVEGLGVRADEVHQRTKRDVDSDDADLFDRAAEMLG